MASDEIILFSSSVRLEGSESLKSVVVIFLDGLKFSFLEKNRGSDLKLVITVARIFCFSKLKKNCSTCKPKFGTVVEE